MASFSYGGGALPPTVDSLNLSQLEDVMENDTDNLDQLQYWYEQLSEVEVTGNESPETLEILCRGLRWVMQYEHTTVEELKEIAEKEAVEMAEKEENWEQEKEMMRNELSTLRERITSKAGLDDMNEAFRAEIDSLKAEINHLKQQNRDRDRELADRQDKNEELAARAEMLEKERTLLTTNQSQLEDTIRELNRRISTKSEVNEKSDWEARKLKQRSEQAFVLSNQLQAAISQNDHLQSEVNRLTSALESATALIKDTTQKYSTLKEDLSNAEKTVEKLVEENHELRRQLATKNSDLLEKVEHFQANSKDVESLFKAKDLQYEKLKENFNKQQIELEELRARTILLSSEEREAELERLRSELVEATKLARQLFGTMTSTDTTGTGQQLDPTSELRIRLVQMDKDLETANKKIADLLESNKKLEDIAVEKDAINAKVSTELHRLRQMAFGDADEEIKRLTEQMRFREEQIDELTAKCSLLQSELERFVGTEPTSEVEESGRSSPEKPVPLPRKRSKKRVHRPLPVIVAPDDKNPVARESPPPTESTSQVNETETESEEPPSKQQVTPKYLNDVEASAMIISSLNYELMKVMQENEAKESQLKEFEHECQLHAKDLQLARSKINYLTTSYAKLRAETLTNIDLGGHDAVDFAKDARITEMEIRLIELERLADSIKVSGTEVERRLEEAARKLIYVQIKASDAERKFEAAEKLSKNAGDCAERLRAKLRTLLTGENRRIKQLTREYELNMIEIARLQNTLIHSVPLTQYNKVLTAYKSLSHKCSVNVEFESVNDLAFDPSITAMTNISANFGLTPEQNATVIENLSLENNKLTEMSTVLEAQNEFLQRETQRQKEEIGELNAFLADIENQTELKSLIVNIERRFLQALREQADTSDVQYFTDREVETLHKKLNLRRRAWREERQNLVSVISGLQHSVQKLRAATTSAIRMDHLVELRTTMDKLRRDEANLADKTVKLDAELANVEVQKALVDSQMASIRDVVEADYNIQRLQKSMQGYQFNIIVLSNELKAAKMEISRLRTDLSDAHRYIEETDKEHQEMLLTQIDISKLSQWKDDDDDVADSPQKEEQPTKPAKSSKRPPDLKEIRDRENSVLEKAFISIEKTLNDEDEITASSVAGESDEESESQENTSPKRTVIYDNSSEYERQLQQVKETARVCIKNYEDQLTQKENAINEYRRIVELLKTQITTIQQQSVDDGKLSPPPIGKRPSSILFDEATLIEKERVNITLNRQVRELERANSDLITKIEQLEDKIKSFEKKLKTTTPKSEKKPPKQPKPVKKNVPKPEPPPVDDDFEAESDDSDREGAKTPVAEEFKELPKEIEPSDASDDDDSHSKSSSMDGSTSGGESDEDEGGTTDSGTVEDIDERPSRRPSRSSSSASNGKPDDAGGSKTSKGSTPPKRRGSTETVVITKPTRPATTPGRPLVVAGDDREHVIYNQRNEIRKLRERIAVLERKARTLETERDAWRERNRFGGKKEQYPDAELVSIKKENDRLRRETKNLTRTLENQKNQIDELQKALTKRNTLLATKETLETWEEKKKREQSISAMKKRIEALSTEKVELMEKLERREKHIEQIQIQAQSIRPAEHEKIQQLMRLLKAEKGDFEVREAHLKEEINVWTGRNKETLGRLEIAFKEINSLKIRNERLQTKLKELESMQDSLQSGILPPSVQPQPPFSTRSVTTSMTSGRFSQPTPQTIVPPRKITVSSAVQVSLPMPMPPSLPPRQPSLPSQPDNTVEMQQLNRKIRHQELRITELTEQYESVHTSYATLQESYSKIVRLERERMREPDNIAVIPVLRDKLKAKDKEIEVQRHKIDELEKRLFYPQF